MLVPDSRRGCPAPGWRWRGWRGRGPSLRGLARPAHEDAVCAGLGLPGDALQDARGGWNIGAMNFFLLIVSNI